MTIVRIELRASASASIGVRRGGCIGRLGGGNNCPNVLCKFVDTDALLQDDSCRYKLRDTNIISAKEAFQKFVMYFVKPEAQADLLKAEGNFDW